MMRTQKARIAGVALAAGLMLAACGDDGEAIATAKPATGEKLIQYSKNITDKVQLGRDGPLVQYFCQTTLKGPCPADIVTKLKTYGLTGDSNGVDLAYIFTVMAADAKDGTPDKASSDEDFVVASYHVVLNRDPDEGGGKTQLAFIKDTGQRKTMLRSLLQSKEFQTH